MKITLYNVKGWAGKTILDTFIPEERLLTVSSDEPFPKIPKEIDIVFDLAGSISRNAHSITSAIEQSDVVIVPIYNEIKCLTAGLHTILEVANFNKNIIVVACKLTKQKGDSGSDWSQYHDFKNIRKFVHWKINFEVPILPLKFSKVFDLIFENEQSIQQLMKKNPLAKYAYKLVNKQFNGLYTFIDTYDA